VVLESLSGSWVEVRPIKTKTSMMRNY